ncbi:MAG: hypothetical protein IJ632_05365 [Muribaculaceae bacterium]|nr:hypothetical protein [Muribaculaceae bacterium]
MRILLYTIFLLAMVVGSLPAAAQDKQIDLDHDHDPKLVYDGIDVSSYQKDIDWRATARDKKIKFVYVKATEGATYTSRHYTYNMENARKHGIKVGSYHFLRTGSRIKDQFENFKRSVKKSDQDLIPLIDVETRQGWTAQQLRDSVKVFADLVEEYYGCRPMIYTSSSFFNNLLGAAFADYPLFIARYATSEPQLSCGAKWTLWQFSEKGRISGIDHPVDLCRFNKGCSLTDILIKDNKLKGSKRKASDEVDKKERPGKVDTPEPAMSKKQEQEAKARAEKERKAKERAKKLAEEDAKAKAEKERKAKEKAAKEKAAKEKAEKEKAAKEKAEKEKAAKEKAAKEKAAKEKAEKEKAAAAKNEMAKTAVKSRTQLRQEQVKQQKQQLAASQRNDSIRKAQQKGKKTNKSSADND